MTFKTHNKSGKPYQDCLVKSAPRGNTLTQGVKPRPIKRSR